MKNRCNECKIQSGTIRLIGKEKWQFICVDCFKKLSEQATKKVINKFEEINFKIMEKVKSKK